MPYVDLIATKDFSYATRRLKAGDSFTVPERMARVLVGIGKATAPREPGKVAPPPQDVTTRAMTATPQRAEPAKPVPAMSTASTGTTRKPRRRRSATKKG